MVQDTSAMSDAIGLHHNEFTVFLRVPKSSPYHYLTWLMEIIELLIFLFLLTLLVFYYRRVDKQK